MVQGVTDRAIATLDPAAIEPKSERDARMLERMKVVRTELGDLVLERLRRLPTQVRFPLEDGGELLLVHGSPADPGEAMTHDMSDEELSALIGDDPADLIVCGMSHVPFDPRRLERPHRQRGQRRRSSRRRGPSPAAARRSRCVDRVAAVRCGRRADHRPARRARSQDRLTPRFARGFFLGGRARNSASGIQ